MSAKLYFFYFFFCLILMLAKAFIIAKPWCQDKCGNISIPYPFGIGSNCSIDRWAEVKCDTRFNPPKVFFSHSNLDEVVQFSIDEKYNSFRMKHNVSRTCSDGSGALTSIRDSFLSVYNNTPFSLSSANNFTVIGCNIYGKINGVLRSEDSEGFTVGCTTHCDNTEKSEELKCPGPGCCQVPVDYGTGPYKITVEALNVSGITGTRCGAAFMSDEEEYKFNKSDMQSIEDSTVRIFFTVGNRTCEDAQREPSSYACNGKNSKCGDAHNGYYCRCEYDYEGNPYLDTGCPNLIGGNECNSTQKETCKYKCIKYGEDRFKCAGKPFLLRELKWILLGAGLGFFLLGGGVWMYYMLKCNPK